MKIVKLNESNQNLNIHNYVKQCIINVYNEYGPSREVYNSLKKALTVALNYTIDELFWDDEDSYTECKLGSAYNTNKLTESYEDDFWNIYNKDPLSGEKLE